MLFSFDSDDKTLINDWFDLLFTASWQTLQYTEGQIQLIKSIKTKKQKTIHRLYPFCTTKNIKIH